MVYFVYGCAYESDVLNGAGGAECSSGWPGNRITGGYRFKTKTILKVLVYSTVSQLGFMFLALGSGAYIAAVFHVMTHAFFKALLFWEAVVLFMDWVERIFAKWEV